jgi:DNA-binding SARP family transcriptional activator
VSLSIRLLGRPEITIEGRPAPPPRGAKSWGLLAYLLLSRRPAGRRHLAELFFPDADDPLGALRWSLAELRRALGMPEGLRGDPPHLELPAGTRIDLRRLTSGGTFDRAVLGELRDELLEGLSFSSSPGFESWLMVERRRMAGAAEALLHETALSDLAAGRLDSAVALASDAVQFNPLDESHHELLVRALALSGDQAAAIAHADRCDEMFRDQMGVAPSPSVRRAAYTSDRLTGRAPAGGRASALGHLEAGEAAAAAGSVESALERLRRACSEAAACGDQELRARALVALGGALVEAVRGRDEEGAAVLHQAIAVAERAGARASSMAAHRELGYIAVQAGRRGRAAVWLSKAETIAEGDSELASVRAVQGMNFSDMADYGPAITYLTESVERAEAAGDSRRAAWSLSLLGRIHVLRGDDAAARADLDRSLQLVGSEHWLSFRPWPETWRASGDMRSGDFDGAAERLEHAFALACQMDDPCWEGISACAIGLLEVRRGRAGEARVWLDEARLRSTRVPDRYEWVHGYVLDALVDTAVRAGDGAARDLTGQLQALAARTGMRELVVRSLIHLGALGDHGALAAARVLVEEIDNPVLPSLLAGAERH